MNRDPNRIVILGIHITDRVSKVNNVQQILTDYGCSIKTRLGLHNIDENFCSTGGIILLEVIDKDGKAAELMAKLSAVDGIEVKDMIFGN